MLSNVVFTPEEIAQSEADLRAVMKKHPMLSAFGLLPYGYPRDRAAKYMHKRTPEESSEMVNQFYLQQFMICVHLLRSAAPYNKAATDRSPRSYGLKHTLERMVGSTMQNYVSNGMCIAAAYHLGIPTKMQQGYSPNIYIALRSKWVKWADKNHKRQNLNRED